MIGGDFVNFKIQSAGSVLKVLIPQKELSDQVGSVGSAGWFLNSLFHFLSNYFKHKNGSKIQQKIIKKL
jgi:hypothetical protein